MFLISAQQGPLISIVTPTYNRSQVLSRAIESVLRQTFTDWELMIVDDGSTDDTFTLLNHYIAQNPQIRYLKQSHRGHTLTRNAGFQAAVGTYLTCLDSDDEYKPDHLQLRLDFLQQHPDVDLLHGGLDIRGGERFVPDLHDPHHKKIDLHQAAVGGTFFGRRKVFEKLRGFKNITYFDDADFLQRAKKYFRIERVDFPTYIYHRESPDSLMKYFS